MKELRNSNEYVIVKSLTSKENRKALIKAIKETSIFFGIIYLWFYGLIKISLFIWNY